MHNSLFIKDIIKRVNALPMTKERRDIHRDVYATETTLDSNETRISQNVTLTVDVDPICNQTLGEDFCDFLQRMGITPKLSYSDEKNSVSSLKSTTHNTLKNKPKLRVNFDTTQSVEEIRFLYFEEFAKRDFSVKVDYRNITVTAGGIEGAWAALADLEHRLKERKAPVLTLGEHQRTARWDHQISQGPWNANYSVPDFTEEYLDEEAFRTYAHYGVNEMMIYGDILIYADSEILPELNFPTAKENLEILKKASEKAYKYGVRFAYLPVTPKLLGDHPLFQNHPETRGAAYKVNDVKTMYYPCSSSKLIQDFYAEVFYKIFKEVPLLAGSTMIVAYESFNHCRVWDDIRAERSTPCPVCGSKSFEEVVALQLNPVKDAIKRANPEAFVNVWMYSFNDDRLKLMRTLTKDQKEKEKSDYNITYTIAKDSLLIKDGYDKYLWDYSMEGMGPAYDTLRQKKFAKEHGMGMFIKTETGIGLEVIQYPYVPALQNFANKWESVRSVTPLGVQQSWLFFGMFASRAEELAYWACYETCSQETYLRRMACRDFGKENTEIVLKAWEYMSEAVKHVPSLQTPIYYNGPLFYGPAHPFLPKGYNSGVADTNEFDSATGTKHADSSVPEIFNAKLFYLMEDGETFSKSNIEDISLKLVITELTSLKDYYVVPHSGDTQDWSILIREFEKAAEWSKKAFDIFRSIEVPDKLKFHLVDDRSITELFYRTMVTCKNLFRYLVARDIENAPYRDILIEELQNAKDSIHIFEEAPYLNLKERIDGYYSSSIDMIKEKVRIIKEMLFN